MKTYKYPSFLFVQPWLYFWDKILYTDRDISDFMQGSHKIFSIAVNFMANILFFNLWQLWPQ